MPVQLQDVIRRARSLLREEWTGGVPGTGARMYTDTELTDWVNDACRDIARRTEDLQNITANLAAIVAVANYPAPPDLIRLHRVEFQPTGSSQVYPVEIRDRNTIDQLIGWNPTIQSSYPWCCWLWGTPGSATYPLTISFYPVFSTAGAIRLWYFRMPQRIGDPVAVAANYLALVDLPEGWDDLVVLYVVVEALKKARNAEWQVRKQDYEAKLANMIDVTRAWHDQANQMVGPYDAVGHWSMGWLYGSDY